MKNVQYPIAKNPLLCFVFKVIKNKTITNKMSAFFFKKNAFSYLSKEVLYFFGIFVSFLPTFFWHSISVTGDQNTYVSIAMEMWQRHQWDLPFLFGVPCYLKPPFLYWSTLVSWNVFGINTFSTFFPIFLALLGSFYFLKAIGTLLSSKPSPPNGALLFVFSLGTWTFSSVVQMEIWLVFFILGAWWGFLKALVQWEKTPNRSSWIYVAFFFAGVLSLVKSPLYSVLLVFSFSLYLLLEKPRFFKNKHLYFACLFGVVMGISWFLYAFTVDKKAFLNQYLLRETLHKKGGNGSSPWLIWESLFFYMLPWLGIGIFSGPFLKKLFRKKIIKFFFSYCIFIAFFFTYFPYRVSTYLYPLLPACALLFEHLWFEKPWKPTKYVFGITMLLLFLISFWTVVLFQKAFSLSFLIGSTAILSIGMLYFIKSFSKNVFHKWVLSTLPLFLFFRIFVSVLGETDIQELRAIHQRFPKKPFAVLDESKNIWLDFGRISTSLKTTFLRTFTFSFFLNKVQEGAIGVLDPNTFQKYKKNISLNKFQIIPWTRWKRRSHIQNNLFLKFMLFQKKDLSFLKRRFSFILKKEEPTQVPVQTSIVPF